jgi:hypothetical protein
MSRIAGVALVACALSGAVWAEVTPLGNEFRANTYTTGSQAPCSVASDAAGNFVVVWQSYGQDGSNSGIFGRRFLGRSSVFLYPLPGDAMDCSDPRAIRPTFTWDPEGADRFRVFVGWDPGFGAGSQVTSGDRFLRVTSWTPTAKKWRKACAYAQTGAPGTTALYVKLFRVATSLPKNDPGRKTYSDVVPVNVQR